MPLDVSEGRAVLGQLRAHCSSSGAGPAVGGTPGHPRPGAPGESTERHLPPPLPVGVCLCVSECALSACVCVCMCMCVRGACVCTVSHVPVCAEQSTYVCMCAHTCACVHMFVHVCACAVCMCMHVCVRVCVHVCPCASGCWIPVCTHAGRGPRAPWCRCPRHVSYRVRGTPDAHACVNGGGGGGRRRPWRPALDRRPGCLHCHVNQHFQPPRPGRSGWRCLLTAGRPRPDGQTARQVSSPVFSRRVERSKHRSADLRLPPLLQILISEL